MTKKIIKKEERSTIDVDLKEGKNLVFSFNIISDKPINSKPLIRLVLTITDKLSVILTDGKMNKNGDVEFDIPVMYKMLAPKKYSCDLEMVIDNQFYVPISFDINFY